VIHTTADFEYVRIDDEDEEDGDYSQNNYMITIKYKLL
jgi:hypothetical protein